MDFHKSLTYLFTEVTNYFKDVLDKHLKEIGLHGGQTFVLMSLWKEDGKSQIALAQMLGLSAPTINKMVKSLSRNEFVRTEKCEKDGRVIRVYLTEKGASCRLSVERQWEKLDSSFFSRLNETEKLIFMQILEKLKNGLSEPVKTE